MSATMSRSLIFATALVGAGFFAVQVDAEQNGVTFPPLDDLTHYTTVERGKTVEHILTSEDALAAIKAGTPIPTGTHVVLVDFQDGVLDRYLVAQKTGDVAADWQYQYFLPDQTIKLDERTDQCYSCHLSRESDQFLFTHGDAVDFGG